jgi:serpin B
MDVASVQGQTEFTLNLHKAIVRGKEGENVVLSPLSITMALAMLAAGARGPTLAQISQCVKLPAGEPMHAFAAHMRTDVLADASGAGGPLVALANRAWVDKSVTLKPHFQKVLQESYGSEAASVDFVSKAEEALGKVNEWAEEETHGKINDLLPPGSVNSDTRLVVANALYFKGNWQKRFDSHLTRDREFFLLDGRTITVPMMHTSAKQFVKSFATFKALRLPYNPVGKFAMFVLLPHEKKGLAALEASLMAKELSEDLKQVTEAVTMRAFALPKFKVSCGFEVPAALKALGLVLPFGDKADLSEMVESRQALYVSNMYHKTFVEVNETGTEAAAATAAVIELRRLDEPVNPQEFVCDHPFLFVIKEEVSDVIIFTGRVTDPSKT